MKQLTERGFRSKNAKNAKIKGRGLGLFILQQICEVNHVLLNIVVKEDNYYVDGIRYSPFIITLQFREEFD